MLLHFLVVVVEPTDWKVSRSSTGAWHNNLLAPSSTRCSNLDFSLGVEDELIVCSSPWIPPLRFRIVNTRPPPSVHVHRTCFHLFCCIEESVLWLLWQWSEIQWGYLSDFFAALALTLATCLITSSWQILSSTFLHLFHSEIASSFELKGRCCPLTTEITVDRSLDLKDHWRVHWLVEERRLRWVNLLILHPIL